MNAVPFSFFKADDTWALWTFLIVAAYVCILLEHKYKWASQISGAVLALIIGLVAANLRIIPTDASVWDAVWNFILPLSVTMLLFNADLRRILRESGRLFGIFNISAVTTVIGAFVAVILYHNFIPELNKAAGMMTGSYIGCLLYTSDAADDLLCVDLGGRRIIKKKKKKQTKK